MTLSLLIGISLLFGPIILVLFVSFGVFGYNPERAQGIRAAEAQTPMIMEEVRRIHIRSPDRFKHDRLDRHPSYLAINVAAWAYACCVFAGARVTNNVAALNDQTRLTMAVCFIVGSTLSLFGAAMGARIGRWTLLKGIRDNMTSSMLADDIRLPYTFGCTGTFCMGVSMAIYSTTSFHSTSGSLGGWMSGVTGAICPVLIVILLHRIRRYDRARTTLINEAVAVLERSQDVSD